MKEAAIEWFGPVVSEFYGATEGAATALTSPEWLTKPGSVGYALPGVRIEVLDGHGRSCPAGDIGDVYFSLTVPFEYLHDDKKTAASMNGDLFTAGDIGYVDDDGWLYLCDRRTDLILSGGVNIYPAEVEAVLLRHSNVADAGVFDVPDEDWGQRAVAVVQPDVIPPEEDLAVRLTEHCQTLLAAYKVPREVFVLPQLPRSTAGKLLRRRLRERYESGGLAAGSPSGG